MLDLNAYSATSISEIAGFEAKSTIVISFSAEILESLRTSINYNLSIYVPGGKAKRLTS